MSREIKFRAWDLKEKVMREVNEIAFTIDSITCKPLEEHDKTWEMYDPICFKGCYELMQRTGRKDDYTGEHIWEGDIINCFKDELSIVTYHDKYASFGLQGVDSEWFSPFSEVHGKCEVIGNIYETPSILADL